MTPQELETLISELPDKNAASLLRLSLRSITQSYLNGWISEAAYDLQIEKIKQQLMVRKILIIDFPDNTGSQTDVSSWTDLQIAQKITKAEEKGATTELKEEEVSVEHEGDLLILPVVFTKYNQLKDRSVNLSFNTPEITEQNLVRLFRQMNSHGILLFRGVEQLNKEDVKLIEEADVDVFEQGKSQSQRLRNVLFKLWLQENPGCEDLEPVEKTKVFGEYYRTKTEKIINHFKEKLN